MTRAKRAMFWSALLVGALVAAAVIAYLRYPRGEGGLPPELVPPAWTNVRTSAGHTMHVEKEGIACVKCHAYERDGFKNPGAAVCATCHTQEKAHTHAGNETAKTDCLTCHTFDQQAAPTCISCHKSTEGTHAAIGVHATTACTECHKPHGDPSLVPKDCASCHKEVTPAHAKHAGSKGCFDCHEGHTPAAVAKTKCAECHATPAGPKPASHDSCLTCHKPHEFVAGGARACVECHGKKETLAATVVKEHAECTSCHVPHDPTKAASSCITCHEKEKTGHAGTGACTGCHAPHGHDSGALATNALSTTDVIAAACTSCHQNIAASDTKAHAGGANCTSCHEPHDFAVPKKPDASFCGRCHAKEQTMTAMMSHQGVDLGLRAPRITQTPGHADCASCHGTDAHKPKPAPACGTCHANELASAPAGHQQRCTTCHESHSGARTPQAACGSCHARESNETHSLKVGNCESCHRPHGPDGIAKPPACTSCHAPASLPGLHAETRHQTCESCHAPHEAPRADRMTCTSTCHADKKSHQPQATACNGCHVFRN